MVIRPVVCRDIEEARALDLNAAYALLNGATKPIGMSFWQPDHVDEVVAMFDMARGGAGKFRERPFCIGAAGFDRLLERPVAVLERRAGACGYDR